MCNVRYCSVTCDYHIRNPSCRRYSALRIRICGLSTIVPTNTELLVDMTVARRDGKGPRAQCKRITSLVLEYPVGAPRSTRSENLTVPHQPGNYHAECSK